MAWSKSWKYVVLLILVAYSSISIYRWMGKDYAFGRLPFYPDTWRNDGKVLVNVELVGGKSVAEFVEVPLEDSFLLQGSVTFDQSRWSYSKLSEGSFLVRKPVDTKRLNDFRQNEEKKPEATIQIDIICKSNKMPGYRSINRSFPQLELKGSSLSFESTPIKLFDLGEYLIVGRMVPWVDRSPKAYHSNPDFKKDWETLDASGEFLFCRKLKVVPKGR